MFDDSERQWLHNPETGGYFYCPVGAVDDWKGRGFVESDPPQEVDRATVELLAAREEEAKARKSAAKTPADDDEAQPKQPSKATKSTAAAKSEEK